MPLSDLARNVHSQDGEDGIIEEVLARLAQAVPLNRWCVEFGAWDGVHLSNTCHLVRNGGYRAVLIEQDEQRYAELLRNHPGDEVVALCESVGLSGEHLLDAILARTPVPADFDVLSVDIDGCDYHVLESIRAYRPKVVIVEYNPTMPNAVDFVQVRDLRVSQGSSARAMCRLAASRGYSPVAATRYNLVFVRTDLVAAVVGGDGRPPLLDELRDDSDAIVYAFSGFDGTVLLSAPLPLPWHGVGLSPTGLQAVPGYLRSYPGGWGRAAPPDVEGAAAAATVPLALALGPLAAGHRACPGATVDDGKAFDTNDSDGPGHHRGNDEEIVRSLSRTGTRTHGHLRPAGPRRGLSAERHRLGGQRRRRVHRVRRR